MISLISKEAIAWRRKCAMGERHERSPWEQHASASGLPRFNYKPLSPTHSLKGFLITCAFDREKSATKEAMPILTKYLGCPTIRRTTTDDPLSDEKQPPSHETYDKNERRGNEVFEVIVGEKADESRVDSLLTEHLHSSQTDERHQHKDAVNLKRNRANFENMGSDDDNGIFLLKMAQKGIISIFWESSSSDDPVILLSKILVDVEKGSTSFPRWCQRMVPVQESCAYSRESLSAVVIKLIKEYLQEPFPTEAQPLKYAISFNRRGFEAREVSKGLQGGKELDRMGCIHLVTAAVASATPHAVVDLTSPQMVVIVEVMPLAGVQSSPICGVAVLSGMLMNTKPKLSVKVLVPASHRAKQ